MGVNRWDQSGRFRRIIAVTNALLGSFQYDPNGNLTLKRVGTVQHAFRYNSLQQLTQINLDSAAGTLLGRYRYDADGKRIGRTDGAGSQDYQYVSDDIIAGYPAGQYQTPLWSTAHGSATDDPLLYITTRGT
ncbi:hypothetical protein [Chitinivorax sp. B]|uniref:hypothetical protein n=1 Tax=Chitinivorax sp. B TaxID=2502235 RepID=UPI0010F57123|nr:hypothetical protein [Chitinivorax sp. B]